MNTDPIRNVVIVGGGTAGWVTASLLGKAFGTRLKIRLIESDAIGTVGVGEATIPQIRHINQFLGLDEREVLKASQGTYKLGIQFNDWGRIGDSYMHAFGDIGLPHGLIPFQHYWLRDVQGRTSAAGAGSAGAADVQGPTSAADLWSYSPNTRACMAGRMAIMDRLGTSPMTGLRHAYHLDAGRYAQYLRRQCDPKVVARTEGKVVDVKLRGDDGFIESLHLESGETVQGDLFIDCSGFRSLLIEQALGTGYDDWRHWLPCDRAAVVASARVPPMRPYTQANARNAGWQWRIPLQHRNGNGHVFCSEFISDDEAIATLMENLEGEALGDPHVLRFTTGCRRQPWTRNCVAIGLSAGFVEPLESTGIHLIQSGVGRLLSHFPDRGLDPALIDSYNRGTRFELERIRDFLILHYHAIERDDTPFWRHCANIDIPQSLQRKLELFRASGQIFRDGEELFTDVGWLQVMVGQHVMPERYHPLADTLPQAQLDEFLDNMRTLIGRAVDSMPTHEDFIARHCRAPAPA